MTGRTWHAKGGDDVVTGTSGDDIIKGGGGDDVLRGGNGADQLWGEDNNDILEGGGGADQLSGGGGINTASYVNAPGHFAPPPEFVGVGVDLVSGGFDGEANGDTYSEIQNVFGSSFADDIRGDGNANELYGGGGNDILEGRGGADYINGGSETDTITYVGSSAGVNVSLFSGTGLGGDAEGDTYFSVENVDGSLFADFLTGDDGINVLFGNDGNDLLGGLAQYDQLWGGNGDDTYFLYDVTTIIVNGAGGTFSQTVFDDVHETLSGGVDNVHVQRAQAGLDVVTGYTLAANVENGQIDGTLISTSPETVSTMSLPAMPPSIG